MTPEFLEEISRLHLEHQRRLKQIKREVFLMYLLTVEILFFPEIVFLISKFF